MSKVVDNNAVNLYCLLATLLKGNRWNIWLILLIVEVNLLVLAWMSGWGINKVNQMLPISWWLLITSALFSLGCGLVHCIPWSSTPCTNNLITQYIVSQPATFFCPILNPRSQSCWSLLSLGVIQSGWIELMFVYCKHAVLRLCTV